MFGFFVGKVFVPTVISTANGARCTADHCPNDMVGVWLVCVSVAIVLGALLWFGLVAARGVE